MSAWLKKLRHVSTIQALPLSLLFMALGVVCFFATGAYNVFQILQPKTLTQLTPDTAVGAYVSDDIPYFYGEFIEEMTYKDGVPTGEVKSRYYIVDFDPQQYYMALKVHAEDLEGAETMMKASDAFYDAMLNNTEPPALPSVHVQGTIRAMEEEDIEMLEEYSGGDENFLTACLPIYLDVGIVGTMNTPTLVVMIALSALFFLFGFIHLLYYAFGGGQKQVKKKLATSSDPEYTVQAAAKFYAETTPIHGVYLGPQFVFLQRHTKSTLLFSREIAWAYGSTAHHGHADPSTKPHAIELRLMDGTRQIISMPEKSVHEVLEAMQQALPGTVFGYSDETEALYRTSRDVFAARWEQATAPAAAEVPEEEEDLLDEMKTDNLDASPADLDDLVQTPEEPEEESPTLSLHEPTDL